MFKQDQIIKNLSKGKSKAMNYEDKLSRLQKDPCEFAQNAIEELLYIILRSVKNGQEFDKLVGMTPQQ